MPVTADPKVTVQEAVHALEECGGNISAAARKLTVDHKIPVTRANLKTLIDKSPALISLMEDMRESLVDEAEAVISDSVRHLREREDAKFVLRTLGSQRGYVPKTEAKVEVVGDLSDAIRDARNRSRGTGVPPTFGEVVTPIAAEVVAAAEASEPNSDKVGGE